jgi:SNF2 family DNA or RNA helicase
MVSSNRMTTMQISAKHRKIIMPVTATLENMFPDAPRLTQGGNTYIAIPHGADETRFLRNLGIAAPAPILSQYDWAGGTPFAIQRQTAALMTLFKRAYVLNSFGTGKTKSALWAWDYLHTNALCGKMLVVAPLSTLTFTWASEVFKTLPGIKTQVLHGTRAKRLERLADKSADIYIVNHDGLETIYAELAARTDIDTLCIDELAAYRNNTNRTKIIRKYAKPLKWVWGMTGAPVPNAPTDAWSQATIITPNTVPAYFNRFRDEVMQKITQFKYIPREGAIDRVYQVLQPSVRYTLNDVMELPQLVERTQDVELGPEQKRVYDAMVRHARVQVAGGEIDAMNAGAVLNKLLQISTGYVYKRDGSVVGLDNDKRLDALTDAVQASENKVIVFVPFKHALAGIAHALTREGIDVQTISGDTPKPARDYIFHTFQNTPQIRVLAAHPATMSHGLTLTAADTIIWFGPTTSLETFEQANARITRVGQKNKQLVLMLQGTKVEKMMYAKLRAKQKIQNALLDMIADSSDIGEG